MPYFRPYPFELTPIGKIWAAERKPMPSASPAYPDHDRGYTLELDAVFYEGCFGLDTISHLTVLYWLRDADRSVLKSNPPDGSDSIGIFASLSEDRPNPIGLGTATIIRIEKNLIHVRGCIDCQSGSPLLDLRPRFPWQTGISETVLPLDACT